MKHKQRGYTDLIVNLILLGIVAAVIVGALFAKPFACHAKWSRSGMQSSWGPLQGCVVRMPDGRWIPEERVREIDIDPRRVEQRMEIPR